MARLHLKYVSSDIDRHGNVRYYVRRAGCLKVRLPGSVGSEEFMAAYHQAMNIRPASPPSQRSSMSWLIDAYFRSEHFKQLEVSTRRARQNDLLALLKEPISDSNHNSISGLPFLCIPRKKIEFLRDRKSSVPEAANHRLKALSALFSWAITQDLMTDNPTTGVSKLTYRGTGHHTWSIEEVQAYERFHALGTRSRLAMALLLLTGQRRSDIILFGRHHVRDGWITFTQQKNRKRNPVHLTIPILPELQAVIDPTPSGQLAFLTTEHGQPFTNAGFGNRFRSWCDAAGLQHCTAHGLRKAGACIAAENGATEHQLMAIFGWKTTRKAARYTKAVNQK